MTGFQFTGEFGKVIILDNRDSFVFNIAHRLWEVGVASEVVRSDHAKFEDLRDAKPRALIISPGPGHPRDAGISERAIEAFSGTIPILGICLGHQAIGEVFGGVVAAGHRPRHGMSSSIAHHEVGLFEGIPNGAAFGRYHSLVVERPLPPCLREIATEILDDGAPGFVMAMEHCEHPTYGVQFHPESILSPHGTTMFANFCRMFDLR